MAEYTNRFSAENTLALRASDLLFRFADVAALLRRWLGLRPDADASEQARADLVPRLADRQSRSLSEARLWYSEPSHRLDGFSEAELRYMERVLDPALMARWGYDHPRPPGAGSAAVAAERRARRHHSRRGVRERRP